MKTPLICAALVVALAMTDPLISRHVPVHAEQPTSEASTRAAKQGLLSYLEQGQVVEIEQLECGFRIRVYPSKEKEFLDSVVSAVKPGHVVIEAWSTERMPHGDFQIRMESIDRVVPVHSIAEIVVGRDAADEFREEVGELHEEIDRRLKEPPASKSGKEPSPQQNGKVETPQEKATRLRKEAERLWQEIEEMPDVEAKP